MKKGKANNQREEYEKTMNRTLNNKAGSMTIMVTEDTYDKALTAFNIAVAGAELGIKVSIFFTSRGINILKRSYKPRKGRWGEAPIGWKETYIKTHGGPILSQLMYQAQDMGVIFYICYTTMISMGYKKHQFLNNIQIIRMAEFLQKAMEADAQYVLG